ncbi:DUF805 domain-containing protein [Flavobacterium cheongpyeongense]|uniref:DUF805 domain-containing protein n=1 Tax=Flavobacterium cheongpyeongense TaxID=2212651 RepID=A0A2V4BM56_9FLAO|nr:DUF805 domain-containing protein [Flavobacterium cheongpyeongense]PXY40066.1 DUF805 domain-containing protein [Flavobacterium cheongpyeongense]
MIEWYKKVVFENYANFNGRARRSEYWYFVLAQILIIFGVIAIGSFIGTFFNSSEDGFLIAFGIVGIYLLAILIPYLALIVRRMHDIGKSGWFYLVRFIPVIGGIWILVLLCTEGNYGENNYGLDPKEEFDEINEIGSKEA